MAKRTIEKKSSNNFTKDGKAKTFIIGKYLAEQLNWSRFTYKEIIAIANLIADVNPNANEIKPLVMTAKEFNDKCCFKSNFGTQNMNDLLLSIQSKSFSVLAPKDYNPDRNIVEEYNKEKNLTKESEFEISSTKEAFPLNIDNISFISASRVLVNQDKDLTVRAKQMQIFLAEPMWTHLLVARNAYKDDNGNIRGVEQYYSTKLHIINSFKTEYALRLYMNLLRYNDISKKFSWDDIKSLIGKKTQRATFKIEQKSRNSKNPKKISKERKEFENFKLNTLPKIFEEIRECTGLDYSYELRVAEEIAIIIHIPNRTDNLPLWDEIGFKVKESDDSENSDGESDNNKTNDNDNDDNNNVGCDSDIDLSGDKPSGSDTLFWSDDSEFDWDSVFNQMDYEDDKNISNNGLNDEDLQHIDNLYKIYSIKINISKKEIEEIFINNNKDPKLVNKILSKIK